MTKMGCSAKWIDLVSFWDPFSVPFFSFFPFLLYRIFVAVWGSAFCFFLVHFWGPIWVQKCSFLFWSNLLYPITHAICSARPLSGVPEWVSGSILRSDFINFLLSFHSVVYPRCVFRIARTWLLGPVRRKTETQVLSHVAIWWMYVAVCHSPEKNPVFQFRAM